MICNHCGKEIPKISKFCRYCGETVSSSSETHTIDSKTNKKQNSEKNEYAGFWIRLAAYAADLLGIFFICFLLGILLYAFLDGTTADSLIDSTPDIIISYIAYVIYNTLSLSVFSSTLGKSLYGLSLTTENGESLSFSNSLKRSLLQPLSTLFYGVGYWSMGKNSRKQAWHDKSAGTVVVRKQKNLFLAYIITLIALTVWAYFTYVLE